MGDRGQVLISDINVYLYTYWTAYELVEVVKRALAKKWRWDDPEYLARIIFCEMVKGREDRETGYGIGTKEHGDIRRLVTIDCVDKTVEMEDYNEIKFKGLFEEFLEYEEVKEL